MTIKVKQVLNKVRELAHTRPGHVYRKESALDQCSYVGPGVGGEPIPEQGCIMGQAMMACGVEMDSLHTIEGTFGAMSSESSSRTTALDWRSRTSARTDTA